MDRGAFPAFCQGVTGGYCQTRSCAGEAAVIHPIEAPVGDQGHSAKLVTVGMVTSVDEDNQEDCQGLMRDHGRQGALPPGAVGCSYEFSRDLQGQALSVRHGQ